MDKLKCDSANKIEYMLQYLRTQFETVWSIDTAHHSVKSTFEILPSSAGQCFVTSWLLQDFLKNFVLFDKICVCRGNLYYKNTSIIDNHCWIEGTIAKKNYIIDLTQDQATTNSIYIKSIEDSRKDGFYYRCNIIYDSETNIKPEAIKRANILKKRLGWD